MKSFFLTVVIFTFAAAVFADKYEEYKEPLYNCQPNGQCEQISGKYYKRLDFEDETESRTKNVSSIPPAENCETCKNKNDEQKHIQGDIKVANADERTKSVGGHATVADADENVVTPSADADERTKNSNPSTRGYMNSNHSTDPRDTTINAQSNVEQTAQATNTSNTIVSYPPQDINTFTNTRFITVYVYARNGTSEHFALDSFVGNVNAELVNKDIAHKYAINYTVQDNSTFNEGLGQHNRSYTINAYCTVNHDPISIDGLARYVNYTFFNGTMNSTFFNGTMNDDAYIKKSINSTSFNETTNYTLFTESMNYTYMNKTMTDMIIIDIFGQKGDCLLNNIKKLFSPGQGVDSIALNGCKPFVRLNFHILEYSENQVFWIAQRYGGHYMYSGSANSLKSFLKSYCGETLPIDMEFSPMCPPPW